MEMFPDFIGKTIVSIQCLSMPTHPADKYSMPTHPTDRYSMTTHPADRYSMPTHPTDRYSVPTHPADRYRMYVCVIMVIRIRLLCKCNLIIMT